MCVRVCECLSALYSGHPFTTIRVRYTNPRPYVSKTPNVNEPTAKKISPHRVFLVAFNAPPTIVGEHRSLCTRIFGQLAGEMRKPLCIRCISIDFI